MKKQPTWDELYNYVDSLAIEGDEKAEDIITSLGYNAPYDLLYDFVDNKVIEGDERAEELMSTDAQ